MSETPTAPPSAPAAPDAAETLRALMEHAATQPGPDLSMATEADVEAEAGRISRAWLSKAEAKGGHPDHARWRSQYTAAMERLYPAPPPVAPVPVDPPELLASADPEATIRLELAELGPGQTWDRGTVTAFSDAAQDLGAEQPEIQAAMDFYAAAVAPAKVHDLEVVKQLKTTWMRTAKVRGIPPKRAHDLAVLFLTRLR
jgi:hypothetical protein